MDVKKAAAETKRTMTMYPSAGNFTGNPELSLWWSSRTAQRIEEELDKFGIPHTRGKTGVLGTLKARQRKSAGSACEISTRCPLRRRMGGVYRSENAGVMHACGHDAHAACAKVPRKPVEEQRRAFGGKVRLVFQPGEEIGKVQSRLSQAGVLDGAERVFGLHTAYDLEAGTVGLKPGINNAAVDHFRIRVHGKSTACFHAASGRRCALSHRQPDYRGRCRDWLRRTSPTEPVITRYRQAERRHDLANAVAAFAEMEGTTRTISRESHDRVRAQVSETAQNIAALYGARRKSRDGLCRCARQ